MAKPVAHYGKWRIRWVDEAGQRRSEVFDSHADAALALQRHELVAKEVRLGVRLRTPPKKTINDLCDEWIKRRAPLKRSEKDDLSIIRRRLRPSLGPVLVIELNAGHVDRFRTERKQLDSFDFVLHRGVQTGERGAREQRVAGGSEVRAVRQGAGRGPRRRSAARSRTRSRA
jgi:hypothetical protein